MTDRMRFKLAIQQYDLDSKIKTVDPQMVCFGNALADVDRAIKLLGIQYKNADNSLNLALADLKSAYDEVAKAYVAARRGSVCIDDYVNYIRPDYISVDNGDGMTSGMVSVKSVKAEVDTDGIHMYVTI